MSPLLKVLLGLAVALPLGGFVVGSLVSAAGDEPPARPPVQLQVPSPSSSSPPTKPARPSTPAPTQRPERPAPTERGDDVGENDDAPAPRPQPQPVPRNDDRGDDRGDDRNRGGDRDDRDDEDEDDDDGDDRDDGDDGDDD